MTSPQTFGGNNSYDLYCRLPTADCLLLLLRREDADLHATVEGLV